MLILNSRIDMKYTCFLFIVVVTLLTSCMKSPPPIEESVAQEGEILIFYNDTGTIDNRSRHCDEATNLTFILTSGNAYKEFDVPAGDSYFAFFDVKVGEKFRVTVKDAKTETEYTTQTQIINTAANKQKTEPFLPLQTVRVCPRDKLEFINF